ncbi:MAG: shikimate dehydrogenase [Anaerolineae bacterium]|nr:MAG: shikimate dehydrogenase [Anaerolineae bacterium]
MADSQTKLVGLIGWPVEHSVSPAMHNAAFEALGLNWRYVLLPVRPGQVETAVRGLGALGFRGANVTVPHKGAVIPALDSLGPNARALGAVNTLVIGQREDGRAVIGGFNTDDKGALSALRGGGFEPEEGGCAVVVGAGGAARAVVFGLLRSGIGEVAVLSRTLERARALVADLSDSHTWLGTAHALPLTPETLTESARTADLLVNATPVGMWPHGGESLWPDGVPLPAHLIVFDLVYNPLETRLLGQVRESGARPVGGLGMLVHQGALAFQMWTGEWPPTDVMRAAAEKALCSGH